MFDKGLEDTGGFETSAFCEINKYCRRVLDKHWPNIIKFSDIKELQGFDKDLWTTILRGDSNPGGREYQKIDVVTASWPCQGHSVAGKKKGLADERSGLWKEVKRILQETQPRYFIGENSANLRTNGLTEVLQDLWEVGFRGIEWHVLPACAFGAIHRRERVYIIANRDGVRLCEKAIASQKTKQVRRAKAWITKQDWKETTSRIRRMVNADTTELDESERRTRVKQCGNSLISAIPEWIGNQILNYEKSKC